VAIAAKVEAKAVAPSGPIEDCPLEKQSKSIKANMGHNEFMELYARAGAGASWGLGMSSC